MKERNEGEAPQASRPVRPQSRQVRWAAGVDAEDFRSCHRPPSRANRTTDGEIRK